MIDLLGSLEDNVIKLTGDKEKTYEPEIYDKLGTELSNSLERAKEKALKVFDWFPKEKQIANRNKRAASLILGAVSGLVAFTALTMAGINMNKIEKLEDLLDENSDRITKLELTSEEQD